MRGGDPTLHGLDIDTAGIAVHFAVKGGGPTPVDFGKGWALQCTDSIAPF